MEKGWLETFMGQGIEGILGKRKRLDHYWTQPDFVLIFY
jgi:hypothetical protein